jgi:peptide/nickel transport system permease protein
VANPEASTADLTVEPVVATQGKLRASEFARTLRGDWPAVIGGVIVAVIVAGAALAPLLTPYDPVTQDVAHRLEGPSAAHPLGTDDFGRDILARLLFGARSVLVVGASAIALALLLGTVLGIVAGYYGGWRDTIISRTVDIMLAFPLIILAILIVLVLGRGFGNLIVAIAVSQVPLFTRLARSATLALKNQDFVRASVSVGTRPPRILRQHILPNVMPLLLVQAVTTIGLAILDASALNFLGLGVSPPDPDWGVMVSDFQRYVFDRPSLPFYPGAAIAITVVALNLLGDGLVKAVDPMGRRLSL